MSPPVKLRVLSAGDLREALPMPEAVAAMKGAFADFSSGRAVVPQRAVVRLPGEGAAFLVKPAVQPGTAVGAKLLTYLPENPQHGRPLIQALVLLFDPETGAPTAACEGAFLTAWRTGAASGAATDLLARPEAKRAAIFGSGVQARTQLLAIVAVREIESVRVYSPTPTNREAFAAEMRGELDLDVTPAASPEAALDGADIICAATTSSEPVFPGRLVSPGVHVNGAGSFTPEMRELDLDLVRRATVFVDSRASAAREAGELIEAARQKATRPEQWTEVGEVVEGTQPGRTGDQEITLFKSVGLAVQDTAAGAIALDRARELGIGTEVEL